MNAALFHSKGIKLSIIEIEGDRTAVGVVFFKAAGLSVNGFFARTAESHTLRRNIKRNGLIVVGVDGEKLFLGVVNVIINTVGKNNVLSWNSLFNFVALFVILRLCIFRFGGFGL